MAFQYQQQGLLQRLLSAVFSSTGQDPGPAEAKAVSDLCPCLVAAAAVLDAVIKVQEAPGK